MRSLRAVKYRKKYKKLVILAQLLAIWYAVVLSTAVLTSDTFAFFSDSDQTKMSIQTGTWWDGSDLSFISESADFEACVPIDITIKVINNGFDMFGSTEYEVYYSENEDPKKNGQKVGEGVIDPINQGQNTELIFENADIGTYIFKLYQREGYDDDYEERTESWSEKFFVIECVIEEAEDLEIDEVEETDEIEEKTEEDVVQEEELEKEDTEQPTETKVEDNKSDSEKEKTDKSNEDNQKEKIEEKEKEKEKEKPTEEQPKKESKETDQEIEVNKVEMKKMSKSEKEEEESESTKEGDE